MVQDRAAQAGADLCPSIPAELLELRAQSERDLQRLQHRPLLRLLLPAQGLGEAPPRLWADSARAAGPHCPRRRRGAAAGPLPARRGGHHRQQPQRDGFGGRFPGRHASHPGSAGERVPLSPRRTPPPSPLPPRPPLSKRHGLHWVQLPQLPDSCDLRNDLSSSHNYPHGSSNWALSGVKANPGLLCSRFGLCFDFFFFPIGFLSVEGLQFLFFWCFWGFFPFFFLSG